jgi:predicted DNA-binding transcriptional regulator AlpA
MPHKVFSQSVASSTQANLTPECLMRRAAAAEFLGCSSRFLENAALRGNGPRFIKVSPRLVLYRLSDLQAWLEAHARVSTSEAA